MFVTRQGRIAVEKQLKPGDWVIYRKLKRSTSPGPRAKLVSAAPQGETYTYMVDKFWVVKQLLNDGQVVLVTRTGKQHTVDPATPNLRPANWWERWLYRDRFRQTETLLSK